ncbi:TetR/AcrR family transcriptional regulator [Mycobacteroides abscessus]|uniref:TetR/AcrR family transcriptional regulator n=1 Tax=Mycobacteroides abscessus TaxID=36809 RepID=UPI0009260C01|nr:TetR/AcrR family transcriptional regulator [Mycobacteroides abscessus]MDO3336472.1 helix-turn-helix domain containing protein [Mycobacteroides abscessus subsp. bolletii]QSM91455.1 TetR/AcrR family transcriptional regulator [Mycobacteroides abscessus subsp. bolletii]SIB92078.1 TetR family transcriptional regulator [Mycobacteroides abscessus subsp. bolletii]SKS85417.1 TetR family transcriptional regulator [Mycobacteroides abscessus subsp. bolletii]SKT09607.1 TetR family transcriptional regula
MRSHGWSGNTPASDEEAIARILAAADKIVAERGSAMRIADVARDLGVTRQTVYRYFPSTDALLVAGAMQKADGLMDKLQRRVKGETDPVTALVEGTAFAIESLATDPQIAYLLSQRGKHSVGGSVTSDTAYAFGRSMMHQLDVDWAEHGFDEADLTEMTEFILRVLNSFLLDPGHPTRSPAQLRDFLSRWIGPSIVYPRLAQTLGPLIHLEGAPSRRKRRRTS